LRYPEIHLMLKMHKILTVSNAMKMIILAHHPFPAGLMRTAISALRIDTLHQNFGRVRQTQCGAPVTGQQLPHRRCKQHQTSPAIYQTKKARLISRAKTS